jgi:mRNA interferase MazF
VSTSTMLQPRRGEVWQVWFDPSIGAEIRKLRPAVILSLDSVGRLPLKIVVPITDWKPVYAKLSWFVYLGASSRHGLSKDSAADAFQVKSVSISRFVGRLGEVSDAELEEISAAVALCVGAP